LRSRLEFADKPGPMVLGIIDSSNGYEALIALLQERFRALRAADWSYTRRLDEDNFKRFGPVVLACQLGVLGLKLVAVVDEEQAAKMLPRLKAAKFRKWKTGHAGALMPTLAARVNAGSFRKKGHGRAARMKQLEGMTPHARIRAARHAARKRWAAVKAAAKSDTARRKEKIRTRKNGKAMRPVFDVAVPHPMPELRHRPQYGRRAITAAASARAMLAKV
jgi:hypothetical protein